MKHTLVICILIATTLLSGFVATAQTEKTAAKHFDHDGLAFDYPEGWELIETNTNGVEIVTLNQKGGVAQIVVHVQDHYIRLDIPPVRSGVTTIIGHDNPSAVHAPTSDPPPCAFDSYRKRIVKTLIEKLAAEISAPTPHTTSPVTTQLGSSEIAGEQLEGVINRKPVTGAVYSTRTNRRFVSLSFILAAGDHRAETAWTTVRSTLVLRPVRVGVLTVSASGNSGAIDAGVMNGKAIVLPKPAYPKIASSAHASGTVKVRITIDETGNVIQAYAVDGHPLLQAVSVAAAREAKFSPTKLCGEPVKVTGVISYNFVAQ